MRLHRSGDETTYIDLSGDETTYIDLRSGDETMYRLEVWG